MVLRLFSCGIRSPRPLLSQLLVVRFHSSSLTISPTVAPISSTNVVSSPFKAVPYPEVSLYSQVVKDFDKNGSRVAIVDGVSGREYTYNEIAESIAKFSSALNHMGFGKGDVVSICSPNIPEYGTVFLGALASGGTISTVNPTYTEDELAFQFKNSSAKFIATVPAILPIIQKAAERAGVEKIIVIGSGDEKGGKGSSLLSYHSLVEDSGSLFNPVSVSSTEDIAVLPYSSGTSGIPKGVMLSHHNVITNILQLEHPELLNYRQEGTCLIAVLPFFHIYGMVVILLSSLYSGSKLVT